ncbi:MAG: phospholipid/cholesterol/gamma-HCH transport system substrate-binding protein [Pseudonocardiales bacterium]|jgi:phospholipid/cholesterol/gamma-HCH transport system substrate-binding protein|nr:phospholipid/cholesterol/gamma-HCH transport system substrate-binding protein [Pseudonocardiales bacterium]
MSRVRVLATGVAAVMTLTGCGFHGLYTANLPGGPNLGSHPFTVLIDFANVLDLVPQSNVKVNDVAVGKVISVKLVDWHAQVKVKVNGSVDLPSNAHAAVKMTSLLGEKYVDLEQPPAGTASPDRLTNGAHIPLTSTGTAPEVEEVFGALSLLLNGGGLEQIQTITQELDKALKGNSGAIRDLLTQLNTFVGSLDKQKTDITDALVKIDRLAATLNRQQKSITDALDTFPQALSILRQDRGKLTTLLQSLSTLGTTATDLLLAKPRSGTNATVQSLFVDSLQQLSPVLENLTAVGSDFPKALQILLTFPFPLGKATEFLRSDYANLGLHLNIALSDNLCGLNIPGLCQLITALSPPTFKSAGTAATTPTKTSSAAATPILLPGVGG